MKLTDVRHLPITEDDAITSPEEKKIAVWAANLRPEEVPAGVATLWNELQSQVPSYVETNCSEVVVQH